MIYDEFIHKDPDEFHDKELTLHDCIADSISYENGILRFCLPDGFWITPHHKENDCGKTVRTDASAVDFTIEDIDDITVEVFTRNAWMFSKRTSVEIGDMEQLISAVNSGKCTIEFIAQYRSCFEQMWCCAIRSEKKPCYRTCQLHLPNTRAAFYWNNLCLDREW
ncbi:MAG: hypothetical protein PUE41_00165 [bacterium]|nr:hypothetical protein [bacterium]